ncbi:MAG: FAD-dependent oxidoreductase [Ornithinimicrobium sp.]
MVVDEVPSPRAPVALLVGAGHAHLHVLLRAERLADAGYEVHLLAPPEFRYSGVASASAAGTMDGHAGVVDVAALAASRPVRYHRGRLVGLDGHRALSDDGAQIEWDVLAVNVGSVAAEPRMGVGPGVVPVKPLDALAGLRERIEAAAATGAPRRVTVVGAGPSGLELAGHLSTRSDVEVHLIDQGPSPLAGLPPGAHAAVVRLLRARGVRLRTGVSVAQLTSRRLRLRDGSESTHDVAVLATGLAAPGWLAGVGLSDPTSPDAGIPVRSTLQHRDAPTVYATGDCADFLPGPLAKVGVYGVRQGPVLLESLLARAAGEPLPEFVPQRHALQILDLGAGWGLAVRGRRWWLGRSALRLKRRIDARWLRQYR